jgi:hypothetical protein
MGEIPFVEYGLHLKITELIILQVCCLCPVRKLLVVSIVVFLVVI